MTSSIPELETTTDTKEFQLNTIEEAIADIRAGKILIVVDDEDRENEGDFICAAECVTPEIFDSLDLNVSFRLIPQ